MVAHLREQALEGHRLGEAEVVEAPVRGLVVAAVREAEAGRRLPLASGVEGVEAQPVVRLVQGLRRQASGAAAAAQVVRASPSSQAPVRRPVVEAVVER